MSFFSGFGKDDKAEGVDPYMLRKRLSIFCGVVSGEGRVEKVV